MKKVSASIIALLVSIPMVFAQPSNEIQNLTVNNTLKPAYSNTSSVMNNSDITQTLIALNNLYRYIDQYYLYDVDPNKVDEGLISALMDSLGDEYSYYIPKTESDDYQENIDGKYVGIGTYLSKIAPTKASPDDPTSYWAQVNSVFPGGPADRAGIRARDFISHVNGEDVSPLNATEASKLIRGTADEPLTLTIHRGDTVFDLTLQPEVVTTPNTTSGILEGNIGYLLISTFSLTTDDQVKEDIKKLLDSGATSLIIDLRNNHGGIVDSAINIADMFISSGTFVTVEYKKSSGKQNERYSATKDSTIVPKNIPVVLLVNGGTASSSEILTASLKENDRATVIGSKTFGKGIMQSVISFGDGYVQFTTGHYLTPQNNDIHKVGIMPNIDIEDPDYSDEDMAAFEKFMKTDAITKWVDANPEYSKSNIEAFAEANKDSAVPADMLCLLMRNEYIYRMDWDDRPVADTDFDPVLQRAISFIKEGK